MHDVMRSVIQHPFWPFPSQTLYEQSGWLVGRAPSQLELIKGCNAPRVYSILLPWPKKRPLRLCIKSEHCSYHGISKNQAWLRFGVQWCAKSQPATPPYQSPDHADMRDKNSVLILCIIAVAVFFFLARVVVVCVPRSPPLCVATFRAPRPQTVLVEPPPDTSNGLQFKI